MSAIELYRERDGRWRWAYRESDGSKLLPSNEDYADPGSARADAMAAYPGVPIEELSSGDGTSTASYEGRSKESGFARKVAGWLAPVIVLIAWRRSRGR